MVIIVQFVTETSQYTQITTMPTEKFLCCSIHTISPLPEDSKYAEPVQAYHID
jgi:hypothetical protein